MPAFVQTGTILDRILSNTVAEVSVRQAARPSGEVEAACSAAPPPRDFVAALRRETVALIAEVKHASPSKGVLIHDFDPVGLARVYTENGAAALSVLTDERYFGGHLDHLRDARAAVDVPVLRKDFVIDAYQVVEARAAGADCILLIAACLDDAQLADLHAQARDLGMAALVEVHDEREVERALKIEPTLVGINNRDLRTFAVDLDTTARLIRLLPASVTVVAESGIGLAEDVRRMGELGARAVLVGEALVTAGDVGAAVRALAGCRREDK